MFFHIAETCPIKSLIQVYPKLYLDKGWSTKNINDVKIWYKGYSTECNIESALDQILDGYRPNGKWCVISSVNGDFKIMHPILRGFPIYNSTYAITNIKSDEELNFIPCEFEYEAPIIGTSLDQAAEEIGNILIENSTNFFRYNNIPKLNVLCSAGLDSITSWAVVDSVLDNYSLQVYLPNIETDKTEQEKAGTIREYQSDLITLMDSISWGHNISSYFSETNWYLTGFYAEVIQIREVIQGNAIANFYKKQLASLPKESDYLYWFLQRPVRNKAPTCTTEEELRKWCYSAVFSDNQMWHLDNNFHFSPFHDIRITKVMNGVSLDDIVANAFNGIVQRKIIERIRPEFLQLVADYKNSRFVYLNFKKNFKHIKLSPKIEVNIRGVSLL